MSKCFWQKLPALRLLLPFMAGISMRTVLPSPALAQAAIVLLSFSFVVFYQQTSLKAKYSLLYPLGIALQLMMFSGGLLISTRANEKNAGWFGRKDHRYVAVLTERPQEKQNSLKATATIQPAGHINASGKIILYFQKDSLARDLDQGSRLIFTKAPQEIKNSGNPGAFDYKNYCALQGISHQVYLRSREFVVTGAEKMSRIDALITQVRTFVIESLRRFIDGKKEQGLAEALLIGYKNDLDKNLVQAYANTGVVHVIAISGLHLGIIYTLLLWITAPLNRRLLTGLRFLLVITGLWTFTLIAGAQASVARSAVMFTFLAAGTLLEKKSPAVNSLALSALILLCYNPNWLWDVGFQLSYTAVLSILLFFKPLYNHFGFRSAIADTVWKMTAVTISAQFLTLPLTLYYFHQFPLLLLFTNLIAVPLSSLILVMEIALVILSKLAFMADPLGLLITWLIYFLNYIIESADALPFVAWKGISISLVQVCMLYAAIASLSIYFLLPLKKAFPIVLVCLLAFFVLRSYSFHAAYTQSRLIVYNIPRCAAYDIIIGRNCLYTGTDMDAATRRFHILPSRSVHRVNSETKLQERALIELKGTAICFAGNGAIPFIKNPRAIVIVSGKTPLPVSKSLGMNISTLVADGSLSATQVSKWKAFCTDANISFHSLREDGAFLMDL